MSVARINLIANLCSSSLTLDIGRGSYYGTIGEGESMLKISDLQGILVSGISCVAAPTFSSEDSSYLEQETFAAWVALLRNAPCRVLNRPSLRHPLVWAGPLYQRRIARELGVPTLFDDLCTGDELMIRRDTGEDVACMDLATYESFWIGGSHQIVRERIYTTTDLSRGTPQIIVAYVGGRCNASPVSISGGAPSVQEDPLEDAKRTTRFLADELQLQYAFFSFSVNGSHIAFCRVYQYWPSNIVSPLVSWAADAILQALETQ